MKLLLATLCLNEMEWLPQLWAQHHKWPGAEITWVFVEAADAAYARANPGMVSSDGLSVDGTTEFLRDLAAHEPNVVYIPHGFSQHADASQGKCAARQRYLDVAEEVKPDFLWVLDADEFYTRSAQAQIARLLPEAAAQGYTSYSFRFRHPWLPPRMRAAGEPLFKWEVVGGFWGMHHCHAWAWRPGLHYAANHNAPVGPGGESLNVAMMRYDQHSQWPQCVHLAFSSNYKIRQAKHRYYYQRGEGRVDKRLWYVQSRAAWESWSPAKVLPRGARIVPYEGGPIPEVFLPGGLDEGLKPVFDPSFWRRRLEMARAASLPDHVAVFYVGNETWRVVNEETGKILATHVGPGARVLDVGCGLGHLKNLLPAGCSYVGLDLSPELIEAARAVHPGADFRVGDLRALPFEAGAFDWIVGRSVENMVRENISPDAWEQAEKELCRVGKRVLLIEYGNADTRMEHERVVLKHRVIGGNTG